jgi:hypothetical protein
MKTTMKALLILITLAMVANAVVATTTPSLLNYQGVLRDASDNPLNGGFDMVFRFFDAASAGNELLVDSHLAAGTGVVTVTAGLFNVQLGGGSVADGSGPGTYASLTELFRDHAGVWLAVEIDGEQLDPRVQVVGAAYALNAEHLDGLDSSFFLDTSATSQTKFGRLVLDTSTDPNVQPLEVYGDAGGGYFEDTDGDSNVRLADHFHGIEAYGAIRGGVFENSYGSSAELAVLGVGVSGHGDSAGGSFSNTQGSSAGLATGWNGISATGTLQGGRFTHRTVDTTYAALALADYGVYAYGPGTGGYFRAQGQSGRSWVGWGEYGIYGLGTAMGGFFQDENGSGYAYVGVGDHGIDGYGLNTGGYFRDIDSGTYARVGTGSYKINGTGSVNFVQNHPENAGEVIVYTAPEGDEVATYTRGSAQLVAGEARVTLGETFQWVTNPDLGLTAHLTPHGECNGLYVASVTTEELVVRELGGGTSDLVFDYIVYGLRLGFEETSVVQPKVEEAYIPSMSDHQELYAQSPSLRRYNALERFKSIASGVRSADYVDLSRTEELVARIGRFDPAVHGIDVDHAPDDPAPSADAYQDSAATRDAGQPGQVTDNPPASRSTADASEPQTTSPVQVVQQETFGHTRLPVSEPVTAGDVLALDPDSPGVLHRAASIADSSVVGVVVEPGDDSEAVVATFGVVSLNADAGYGSIRAGDLLVSSSTPGHAMRALELLPGTLLGKALEPLETGTGTIRVLVTLR